MSTKQVSPLLKAWYKWKTLRLPWRRQFLAGSDLSGNTYWELRDSLAAERARARRIVKFPPRTHHGDVVVPPAWHQWLRHTRAAPPSLAEQRAELARRERIRVLAAEADARWAAAKPALADAPAPSPAASPARPATGGAAQPPPGERSRTWREMQEGEGAGAAAAGAGAAEDPWKRARGGPGDDWQPKVWDPSAAAKR